jgi:hypothetical protein
MVTKNNQKPSIKTVTDNAERHEEERTKPNPQTDVDFDSWGITRVLFGGKPRRPST